MKSVSKILITKDALCTDYLPCYGNTYWKGKTPNLDELAAKGTRYTRFYTAGGSSDMSYLSMFTGKNPYELDIEDYVPLKQEYEDTLFDHAWENGYECHIIWDEEWNNDVPRCRCFGKHTTIHPITGLRQKLGFKYVGQEKPIGEECVDKALDMVMDTVKEISHTEQAVFLWIHVPHVIYGRPSYGSDIDAFDRLIGEIRQYFTDENIIVSADHGNMNGRRNTLGYGFYVDEPVARIPLITVRKENLAVCDSLVANIDMEQILFGRDIPRRNYCFNDSAYYAQENRIFAIITEQYKYVYHKRDKSEELYDLLWDPMEQFNLINDIFYDEGRQAEYPARELYFYKDWDKLPGVREWARKLRADLWRDKPWSWKARRKLRRFAGKVLRFLKLR